MAKPLIKVPVNVDDRNALVESPALKSPSRAKSPNFPQPPANFAAFPPCVLYECDSEFRISYLSENIHELIGTHAHELIGKRLLSEDKVFWEDTELVSEKIDELVNLGTVSLIHRVLDNRGLPVWVAHSLRRSESSASVVIRGCMVPVGDDKRMRGLDQAVVSRFVHKMGNHFQLLNLLLDSLRKGFPESRETEILQETVEKAIELTRTFSDYIELSEGFSRVEIAEILRAAIMARISLFAAMRITFEHEIDESVEGILLQGDPFVLELAVGHVIQNALEATEAGGKVTLSARVENFDENVSVVRLRVVDSGCGIGAYNLKNVTAPFYTSKSGHDGLGLSLASRFVEMHGGMLSIRSGEGKGTEVEIRLPADRAE